VDAKDSLNLEEYLQSGVYFSVLTENNLRI